MRHILSNTEKQRVEDAIRAAETKTSGEFVCVIARRSDDYIFVHLFWAAMVTLALPAVIRLLDLWWGEAEIYMAQTALFLVLAVIFHFTPLKMFLTPRALQRQYAQRLAREQFFAQGLHRTRDRTGVLLFVSLAERYVEIIADQGINDKVAAGTWDGIVRDFVREVRARRAGQGFVVAVDACGTLLAKHFPIQPDDTNELPNRLIEI